MFFCWHVILTRLLSDVRAFIEFFSKNEKEQVVKLFQKKKKFEMVFAADPSIRDGVLRSGMLLCLHHINFKIFFHPAKFDNFKDEKISEFKTVSVSQRKNLLG